MFSCIANVPLNIVLGGFCSNITFQSTNCRELKVRLIKYDINSSRSNMMVAEKRAECCQFNLNTRWKTFTALCTSDAPQASSASVGTTSHCSSLSLCACHLKNLICPLFRGIWEVPGPFRRSGPPSRKPGWSAPSQSVTSPSTT